MPRHVEVGRDAAVHPPVLALGRRADPLVLDVLAVLRALHDRPDERGDIRGHHLERRLAVDLVLRLAHRVGERLVHERVLEIAVEVGDRARNVVREEAHLRFLRLQRVADLDVVFDVGHDGERAADAAANLAVGEERNAHPARFARQLALAPLVRHGRAGKRALDVALHFRQSVRRQDFLQRVPEDVVGRYADPRAERLVREAQLELAIEVQDRQPDAVGHEPQPVLALSGLEFKALQVVDVAVGDDEAADVALGGTIRVDSRRESRSAAGPE